MKSVPWDFKLMLGFLGLFLLVIIVQEAWELIHIPWVYNLLMRIGEGLSALNRS
ncbi:MAG: hypothetical protein WC244_00265 [Patescibacteria group bacterium]|jgi:hypothetical protein